MNKIQMLIWSFLVVFIYLFQQGRQVHGEIMILITVFAYPLSFLLSRFYKEVFLQSRLLGLPIWAFVSSVL